MSNEHANLEYLSNFGWIPLTKESLSGEYMYVWENDIHMIKLIEGERVLIKILDKKFKKELVVGIYRTLEDAVRFIEAVLNVKLYFI